MSVTTSQAEFGIARGPRALAGVALALAVIAAVSAGVGRLTGIAPAAAPPRPARTAPLDPSAFLEHADPAVLQILANHADGERSDAPAWAAGSPRLQLTGAPGAALAAFPAGPAARPFVLNGPERAEAVKCMTAAVYYEAALEPRAGQEAVAQVVINRVRHADYPKSICGVVFQGADRPGCQFTFACDGSMARAPVAWAWRRARDVADKALSGYVQSAVGMATHYHADWMVAPWAPSMIRVAAIGQHLFFRPPGEAGQPSAFDLRYAGGEARASRTSLIGRPQPSLQAQGLVRVSADGSLLAGRSIVQAGRTVALPPSLFLAQVHGDLANGGTVTPVRIPAPRAGAPAMHAMILMRAAAARAVRAAADEQARLAAARPAEDPPQAAAPAPTSDG